MKKEKWIWMPHPAHFICGFECRFRLATYVGKYIVSTVGEMEPSKGYIDWNKDAEFEPIGCNRLYETMVFKAERNKGKCGCKYIITGGEVDFRGYNNPEEAYKGHMKLCRKWSKKKGDKNSQIRNKTN